MQPADLAEIEGNDLAHATMSLVDRIRPHLTMLAVAVGVAFAGLAAWTLISSQQDAERAQAWDACLTAVASRDAARLGDVATRYPGSAAAVWSQILLADNALAEGGRLVLVDKTRGRERLQAAAELYAGVLGQKPAEMAAERAVFGLARARESLGELEAAKRGYEVLVAEYPASPLRTLAESRAVALARPGADGWYDWFASVSDTPAATTETSPAVVPDAALPAASGP